MAKVARQESSEDKPVRASEDSHGRRPVDRAAIHGAAPAGGGRNRDHEVAVLGQSDRFISFLQKRSNETGGRTLAERRKKD